MQELAIFSGRPTFTEKLHVGRPNLGDRARLFDRLNAMLDRRWLSNYGPLVQEFEEKIRSLTGARHCITVCNATIGLEVMIRAANLSGEVIVPAFTFVATAHALQWMGLNPVFCDVESESHNIDPAKIEALITPRTTAILAVHLWGTPANVVRLQEIADRRGLKLMYDAAHAFGCGTQGRMIGNFGLAEVFSFHATKFLNSFEGGAILTNDSAYAERLKRMTNFGFVGFDHVIMEGTNAKMTEPSAAMGLTGMESMPHFVETNRRNQEIYKADLAGLPGVRNYGYSHSEPRNYQYVIIELDHETCPISRDRLLHVLSAENVVARRYFYPGVHRMEPYRSSAATANREFPVADAISRRLVVLPNGTAMDEESVRKVTAIIRSAVIHGSEIESRLAGQPNPAALPIPGAP